MQIPAANLGEPALFVLTGLLGIVSVQYFRKRNWVPGTATVLYTEVRMMRTGRLPRKQYVLLLVVSYAVKTRRYTTQLRYMTGARYADLQRVAARFGKGTQHPIHYDVRNPVRMAFGEASGRKFGQFFWLGGVAAALAAVMILMAYFPPAR